MASDPRSAAATAAWFKHLAHRTAAVTTSFLQLDELITIAQGSRSVHSHIERILRLEDGPLQRDPLAYELSDSPLEQMHTVLSTSVLTSQVEEVDLSACFELRLGDLAACRALPLLDVFTFRTTPELRMSGLTPHSIAKMLPTAVTSLTIVSGRMGIVPRANRVNNAAEAGADLSRNFFRDGASQAATDRLDRWVAILCNLPRGNKRLQALALVFDDNSNGGGNNKEADLEGLCLYEMLSLTVYPLECNEQQCYTLRKWGRSLTYLDVSLGHWTQELLERLFWPKAASPGGRPFAHLKHIGFSRTKLTREMLKLIPVHSPERGPAGLMHRCVLSEEDAKEYKAAGFSGTLYICKSNPAIRRGRPGEAAEVKNTEDITTDEAAQEEASSSNSGSSSASSTIAPPQAAAAAATPMHELRSAAKAKKAKHK